MLKIVKVSDPLFCRICKTRICDGIEIGIFYVNFFYCLKCCPYDTSIRSNY